jgi:hypothetical protein
MHSSFVSTQLYLSLESKTVVENNESKLVIHPSLIHHFKTLCKISFTHYSSIIFDIFAQFHPPINHPPFLAFVSSFLKKFVHNFIHPSFIHHFGIREYFFLIFALAKPLD